METFTSRNQKPARRKTNFFRDVLPFFTLLIFIAAVCAGVFSLVPKGESVEQYKSNKKKDVYEFTGATSRKWILKGVEFKNGENQAKFSVTVTDAYIDKDLDMKWRLEDTDFSGNMEKTSDNTYEGIIDSTNITPGKYKLIGAIPKEGSNVSEVKSTPVEINISYALYSAWTIDWEGMDVSNTFLNQMDQLSKDHHNMPMTHMFNPRIYTAFGPANYNFWTNWVLDRKAKFGDEIAMHMHMWFDMVRAAGVTPRTTNAWRKYGNGRDVPMSEYTYEETKQILDWGIKQFQAHGLGTPVSFRAGGWFANLDNLKAMEAVGFKIDTSGRDGRAWGDADSPVPSNWSLGPRTLPYHPSEINLNSDKPAPNLKIWEFPNNGRDSYTYTYEEMLIAFNDNLGNGILDTRRCINFLTHPHWFNIDKPKLEKLYSDIDQHLFSKDQGPVIYSTLEQILPAWEADEARAGDQE
ncbi:hypothetical protein JW796_03850 [Candidatus Dojkabacteria bacterium]|nr:hypothetical protein [Candidatus Dojkabacteria bacterium]